MRFVRSFALLLPLFAVALGCGGKTGATGDAGPGGPGDDQSEAGVDG